MVTEFIVWIGSRREIKIIGERLEKTSESLEKETRKRTEEIKFVRGPTQVHTQSCVFVRAGELRVCMCDEEKGENKV